MPLTGNFKADVREMMTKIRDKGKFGRMRKSMGKKRMRKAALAAAYAASRRKKGMKRHHVRHLPRHGGR